MVSRMHVFSVLGSFLLGKAMTSAAQYATVWFVLQIVFKYRKIEIKNGLFTGKIFFYIKNVELKVRHFLFQTLYVNNCF